MPKCSSQPHLSLSQVSFSKWPPHLHKNPLELFSFDSSDLHCPSLDGCDFEVCWSSPFGEDIDRWDSPLGAPVAGNLLQQRDFIGEGSGRQTSTSPSPTPVMMVARLVAWARHG